MKALVPLLLCLGVQAVDPLPVEISPKDPGIRLAGRFDTRDAAGPRMAWAGSMVSVRFEGTSVNVLLKTTGADEFQVVLDGAPGPVLVLRKDATLYRAASGLPDRDHTLDLFKRTEPIVGQVQLLGFQLDKGRQLLPNASKLARRIEIVGDSITCGYGNEAAKESEHFRGGLVPEGHPRIQGFVPSSRFNA